MNNFEPLQAPPKASKRSIKKGRKPLYSRWLIRWHHRLGIIAAFFVVVLSLTGVLLNHTHQLELGKMPVANSWLLSLYGVKAPQISGLAVGEQWLSAVDGNNLYLNDTAFLHCQGVMIGAVSHEQFEVIACQQELLVLSPQLELLERIDSIYQLPIPVTHLGKCDGIACIQSGQNIHKLDLDALEWQLITDPSQLNWSSLGDIPHSLEAKIINNYQGQEITWERVLLDLHSGRITGWVGVLIMDLAALFLGYLALSGAWLYWRRRG